MVFLFAVISVVSLILYFRERSKNKNAERDYGYINTRLSAIADGDDNRYILVPSDIDTVRKTAGHVNDLLEKSYDRQADYNRKQNALLQMFTNISHDLRTPITVLNGYIEMLYLQSQKEDLSPAMRIIIEKMQSNSKNLVHSVNNLFNMAKIQSGDMILNIRRINLSQIVHETILEFYDLLEKEKFHVEINTADAPLYASADTEAVQRILKNLIDNALKYGNSGKFLRISLRKEDTHVSIAVEDHGDGISHEDISDIFTRAYTADRKNGNGLGLAISQGLANAMGASLSVSSIPYERTVFTLQLQS